MAEQREVTLELLPHEREVLLKWNFTPEVRSQLEPFASSDEIVTITVARYVVGWLSSDLNHAIVKKGCRDLDVIELADRLDYVDDTGDGRLHIDDW